MDISSRIKNACEKGDLLPSAAENLLRWVESSSLPAWCQESLSELVESSLWEELNDRFYQTIVFGTGGMRGRTIGARPAAAELGAGGIEDPAHPAVGANALNDINIVRATMGLHRYATAYLKLRGRDNDLPSIVIAHDVRFFSRHFCLLTAATWEKLGGKAFIFDGPRSTPQLSFSVRHLAATTGVVITASHNPSHDNGFKVYFEDGGQVVAPHDNGIVAEVNKITLDEVTPFLNPPDTAGTTLGSDADDAYAKVLQEGIADPELLRKHAPAIVFTPLHGTGAVSTIPALEHCGVEVHTVASQMQMDSRFPTVKSPNPENAEALTEAIALAQRIGADIVLATDPDADRMGVAVRSSADQMSLLTGNMIGSLLAEYRIRQAKEQGILPADGSPAGVLIKTFVTTPLQEAIARAHGLRVINTLTGFKWIAAKLRKYEEKLISHLRSTKNDHRCYDQIPQAERLALLLEHSSLYLFGGEESYGYLASDRVRDKDANGAVLLFIEMASALAARGQTVLGFLDELYLSYGYFLEQLGNVYYEGAAGAAKIQRILSSYRSNPPTEFDGVAVESFTDFGKDTIIDEDGEQIPSQDFYFLRLANGFSYAVRGSGTEPKIKFYVFGRGSVSGLEDLATVKEATATALSRLRQAIEADAAKRAEG